MECNRDEATRAKEIAEKKFTANDVSGAKRFALKAQTLYPDLKGLSQMLAMLDVHLSAQIKIDGESDWYGILGVDPSADDETIKKQYRKLALMFHSDKNKSTGADEAFHLISDARDLLSDNSKRIAYNQKRFPKTLQQQHDHVHVHVHVPPAAAVTPVAQSNSTYTPNWGGSSTRWQQHNSNHHSTSQKNSATNMDVPPNRARWPRPISQQHQLNSNDYSSYASLIHDICRYCCCFCCYCDCFDCM